MKTGFSKIKRWVLENKVLLIFFVLYLTITFVAVLFHENWEDEAQAWLTARDCSPFELIGRMKYEGHFLPWYFIIMPFAKLGLPFKTINLISWAICGISAWLMLKYLPCKKYKRILVIFTLPMIYLYPVVARCYCLIPLATILLIMFYKNRFEKPTPYLLSIILLANTHIYCFMFAFILGLEFVIDWLRLRKKFSTKRNRKMLIDIIATVFITILTHLPLLGSTSGVSHIHFSNMGFDLNHLFIADPASTINLISELVPVAILYILVAIVGSYIILYKWGAAVKIFLPIMWQFIVYDYFFTNTSLQRVFITVFILMFFLVRGPYPSRASSPSTPTIMGISAFLIYLTISSGDFFAEVVTFVFLLFAIAPIYLGQKRNIDPRALFTKIYSYALLTIVAISVITGLVQIHTEIGYRYSDSYATADIIRGILNEDKNAIFLIKTHTTISITPLIAYQNNANFKIYDIDYESFFTYDPLSNKTWHDTPATELKNYCNKLGGGRCYYISSYGFYIDMLMSLSDNDEASRLEKLSAEQILKPIYDSRIERQWNPAVTERYNIYEIVKE